MYDGADAHQSRVTFQTKAGEQDFECGQIACWSEFSIVKTEAYRMRGACCSFS